jgi:hypothetical protein
MTTVFGSFQAQFLDLVGFIVCLPARGGTCYTKYDALTVGWAFVGVFVIYWYDFLVIVLIYRILTVCPLLSLSTALLRLF